MSFDKEQFKQEMDEQIKEAVSLVFESKIKEKINEEKEKDKDAYEKFMKAALKKFGVESPDELDDEKKKEFFDYVDKNWESDEEDEESEDDVKEGKNGKK